MATHESSLVGSLRWHCIDWDGTQMKDAEPPIDGITCGKIREAADRIEALEAALREIGDHNKHGWTLQTELARAALPHP